MYYDMHPLLWYYTEQFHKFLKGQQKIYFDSHSSDSPIDQQSQEQEGEGLEMDSCGWTAIETVQRSVGYMLSLLQISSIFSFWVVLYF